MKKQQIEKAIEKNLKKIENHSHLILSCCTNKQTIKWKEQRIEKAIEKIKKK